MWTTSYRGTTEAGPEAVWDALVALHSGVPIGASSDRFELHGPLAVGTRLTVQPEGQDPFESEVVELEPGVLYADRTEYEGLLLLFRHRIERAEDRTAVTHTLEITGDAADEVGPELGPQISADFPAAMADLLAAAERGVRA